MWKDTASCRITSDTDNRPHSPCANCELSQVVSLSPSHNGTDRNWMEEFVQLLTRDQRRILLYIHSLISNWPDAEEVLQNTNLVLWRKWNEFEPGTNFYCWACRVAHLEVLKWRDRRARDARTFSVEFMDEIGAELARQGDLIDLRHQALTNCLDKLRERDRHLILLRYSDSATTQSVAKQLGRPIKSIYAAVNRIRDRLLECINRTLTREFINPSTVLEDRP
jgi:RNA polymerase sigma-70 factor (ECF subfamily)